MIDRQRLLDEVEAQATHARPALRAALPKLFPQGGRLIGPGWPEGWHPLVVRTLADLHDLVDEADERASVVQITEIHAGLRVHLRHPTGLPEEALVEAQAILARALRESERRCGICGTQVHPERRRGPWDHGGRRHASAHAGGAPSISAHQLLRLTGGLRTIGGWRRVEISGRGGMLWRSALARDEHDVAVSIRAGRDGDQVSAAVLGRAAGGRSDASIDTMLEIERGVVAEAAAILGRL